MMTDEATGNAEATPADGGVPWGALRRNTHHRTSGVTNDEATARRWALTQRRQGDAPSFDAVIFAALRLAARDLDALDAEVRRIEGATWRETSRKRLGTRGK